jgi:hypothetical protein
MALSWLNLLCALKAAIGISKQTLATPTSLPRHRGRSKSSRSRYRATSVPTHGPNCGMPDSLAEAKAAFRAAWERRPVTVQELGIVSRGGG